MGRLGRLLSLVSTWGRRIVGGIAVAGVGYIIYWHNRYLNAATQEETSSLSESISQIEQNINLKASF
jgi:hypothetical protein